MINTFKMMILMQLNYKIFINFLMEVFIVKKNGLMAQNLKVLIKMVKNMERVYFNGVMAVITMGNSMKMKFKVKENINGYLLKDHMKIFLGGR